MKKLALIILNLFPLLIFAQIKELDIRDCQKVGAITQGAYDITNEKCSDGNYRFSFRDFKYSQINVVRTFEFKDLDNAYDKLFDLIVDGFSNTKKEIPLDLPNQFLIIKYMNSLGLKGFSFYIKDKRTGEEGASNFFSKNQAYKLFDKKK